MSIRPQGYIIFGIDNASFEPCCYDVFEEYITISESDIFEDLYLKDTFFDRQEQRIKQVDECLYRSEDNSVVGLIISQTKYDSDFIRGLTVFYPEFEYDKKLDLPIWDKEEHYLYAQRIEQMKNPSCADIEWQWSWFYPAIVETQYMWPVHAYCTRHLFNQIGLHVDYRKFKAMLIWEWR